MENFTCEVKAYILMLSIKWTYGFRLVPVRSGIAETYGSGGGKRGHSSEMINFNQLRIFYEAAKAQNFSRAAQDLCITQPAVTANIRALEEAFDLKLFKRRGRHVVLTEAGSILLQHAHRVFEVERQIERMVGEMHELKRGLLKIGTTKTYARYLMPSLITLFHGAYPDVKIILDEGSSLEMSRALLDLRNELAVVVKVEETKKVKFIPFRMEKVVLFTSVHHPFASREGICFDQLEGQPIIMRESGSGTRSLIAQCFASRKMTPNILVETGNLDFIKDMVRRGEAVSFLVEDAVARDHQEGRVRIVPILDQELYLEVCIAILDEKDLSPAARAFLGILLQQGRKGAPSMDQRREARSDLVEGHK